MDKDRADSRASLMDYLGVGDDGDFQYEYALWSSEGEGDDDDDDGEGEGRDSFSGIDGDGYADRSLSPIIAVGRGIGAVSRRSDGMSMSKSRGGSVLRMRPLTREDLESIAEDVSRRMKERHVSTVSTCRRE
jgi:hypothetical protein